MSFKAERNGAKSVLTGFSGSAFDRTITKLWDIRNKGVCLAHLASTKRPGVANSTSSDNGRTSDTSMSKMTVRSAAC